MEKFAPDGYSLATADDIKVAGDSRHCRRSVDDNLRFDGEPGFHPPTRRPQDYDGKWIAVILAKPLSDEKKEWAVLTGRGKVDNDTLFLETGRGRERFEIRKEWLQRIKPFGGECPGALFRQRLYLSLARNAFPNDQPPEELMQMAKKLPTE